MLHFTTTVIGQKSHETEILVNTVCMCSSYGLPIIGISFMKWGGSETTDA